MKTPPGLFITGTGTEVGKTYVAAMIAAELRSAGVRVGVYKPVASGCRTEDGELVADDAVQLWEAAGRPETLDAVCPQRFAAPLAPHLAAREEGNQVADALLLHGIDAWRDYDVVIVEGAGGLMSPMSDTRYAADLALDLRFPILIVADNVLGVIHQTLSTVMAAAVYRGGIVVAGVVLNNAVRRKDDASLATNRDELRHRLSVALLAEVTHGATRFVDSVDWLSLCGHTAVT